MRTRICPLCDQPMKKAHYCDSCNSFVWKPVYIDIHYNTSGSSGQDCAYDAVQHDYSYHEDGSVTTMPVPERKPVLKRHPKTEKWEAPGFVRFTAARRQAGKIIRKGPIGYCFGDCPGIVFVIAGDHYGHCP